MNKKEIKKIINDTIISGRMDRERTANAIAIHMNLGILIWDSGVCGGHTPTSIYHNVVFDNHFLLERLSNLKYGYFKTHNNFHILENKLSVIESEIDSLLNNAIREYYGGVYFNFLKDFREGPEAIMKKIAKKEGKINKIKCNFSNREVTKILKSQNEHRTACKILGMKSEDTKIYVDHTFKLRTSDSFHKWAFKRKVKALKNATYINSGDIMQHIDPTIKELVSANWDRISKLAEIHAQYKGFSHNRLNKNMVQRLKKKNK